MTDYATAPVKVLKVKDSTFAYRLFGNQRHKSDPPLLLPPHFRGRLDFWDPALINGIAAHRMLLLLDNQGFAVLAKEKKRGNTTTATTPSFKFWAEEIVSFILFLGYKQIDVLGFSMGGFIAQMIALEAASAGLVVRRLILAGTAPSQGPGVESGNVDYFQNLASATTDGDLKVAFLAGFFGLSGERQRIGERWWQRTTAPLTGPVVTTNDIDGQITAMMRWNGLIHRDEGSYDRLPEIMCPTLVLGGLHDRLVPEQNSILLWQRISAGANSNVQLHIYPDSGHGFIFEFHDHCARLVNQFLGEEVHAKCDCEYCEY